MDINACFASAFIIVINSLSLACSLYRPHPHQIVHLIGLTIKFLSLSLSIVLSTITYCFTLPTYILLVRGSLVRLIIHFNCSD